MGCDVNYLLSFFQDNLLNRHEFLQLILEMVESVDPRDTRALTLFLPLVLKVS